MSTHLPALVVMNEAAAVKHGPGMVPVSIAVEREQASWRYIEFFTANMGVGEQRNRKRILDRIVELPLDTHLVIAELKRLTDSGEFFDETDEILQAIDRVDLRHKQAALSMDRLANVERQRELADFVNRAWPLLIS